MTTRTARTLAAGAIALGLLAAPAATMDAHAATLAKQGSRGTTVRTVQANLKVLGHRIAVDGAYGPATRKAVAAFQKSQKLPVTGVVDSVTYKRLADVVKAKKAAQAAASKRAPKRAKTTPAASIQLDPRCMTGRALCVDLSSQQMAWVFNGRVVKVFKVQTGAPGMPTDKGAFKVYMKDKNHRSRAFNNAPMPYAMFFNRGEAVHFSSSFGKGRGSHGCVRIGTMDQAKWLWNNVRVGDKVIVHQ